MHPERKNSASFETGRRKNTSIMEKRSFLLKSQEVKEPIEVRMTMPNNEFLSFVLDPMKEKNGGSLCSSFGGTVCACAEFVEDGLEDVLDFVSEPLSEQLRGLL